MPSLSAAVPWIRSPATQVPFLLPNLRSRPRVRLHSAERGGARSSPHRFEQCIHGRDRSPIRPLAHQMTRRARSAGTRARRRPVYGRRRPHLRCRHNRRGGACGSPDHRQRYRRAPCELSHERRKARLGDMHARPECRVQLLVRYDVRPVVDENHQQLERFRRRWMSIPSRRTTRAPSSTTIALTSDRADYTRACRHD